MNALLTGLKNWKSTLLGAIIAALMVVQSSDLSDWKAWLIPALIAYITRQTN